MRSEQEGLFVNQMQNEKKVQENPEDDDYHVVERTPEESVKYFYGKFSQPQIDLSKAIMVNTADMQFKMSSRIWTAFTNKLGNQIHLGYPNIKNSFWTTLNNWVNERYCHKHLNRTNTIIWNNSLSAVHGVIANLTSQQDKILFFTPMYYYFFQMAAFSKREVIQMELEEKDSRYHINYLHLQSILSSQKVKLIIFCNPWNPCGRIWSYEELSKLAQLIKKYNVYLLSDEIYSDSIEPQQSQIGQGLKVKNMFTSMLQFEQISQQLIYVNSYTKTFNCSGLPLCYSITFNPEIQQKLHGQKNYSGSFCNSLSLTLTQILYNSEEAKIWKRKTLNYIKTNYDLFKSLSKQMLPKLMFFELQSSYLCLVDFKQYMLEGQKLKTLFSSVNICPSFMQNSFKNQKPRSIVRINLAINRKFVKQIVQRLSKAVEKLGLQSFQ